MVSRGSDKMGKYNPTPEETKALRWCWKNNIRISPLCVGYGKSWKIDIIINNKSFKSPESYPKIKCWKKMYEFYKYYYDKHNKDSVTKSD